MTTAAMAATATCPPAQLLPQLVNQLAPDGQIPNADQLKGLLSQVKLG